MTTQHSPEEEAVVERREEEERRLSRIGTLGAIDAAIFLKLNGLYHHPILDGAMKALSRVSLHGEIWAAMLLTGVIVDPDVGPRALVDVSVVMILVTLTVNFGLKKIARRRRPFIAQVKAVVVGHRPSDTSFPSGHTAAGFAGAWLMSSHFHGWGPAFYSLATLIGWSRIYLGVHYPGDVVFGAASGVGLAMAYRWALASFL